MSASVLQSRSLFMPGTAARTVKPTLYNYNKLYKQPQDTISINWSNPLSTGLEIVTTSTTITKRSIGTIPLTLSSGSPKIAPSIIGMGPTFAGGAEAYSGGIARDLIAANPFTLEVLIVITNAPTLMGTFGLNGIVTGGQRGLINFGGGIWFQGGSLDIQTSIAWRTDGKLQHVFCTSLGAGLPMYFYRDGVLIFSATTPALVDASSPTITVGDFGFGTSLVGTVVKAAFYNNRALSANDVASLTSNPWQVFKSAHLPIWTPN